MVGCGGFAFRCTGAKERPMKTRKEPRCSYPSSSSPHGRRVRERRLIEFDQSSSTTSTTAARAAPPSTAGGSDAELCAARDSLKTSVQALGTAVTGIASTGTSGIQTALDKVKTDLASVKQHAKADVAPQVTATESALTALQTAVTNAGSSGITGSRRPRQRS